MCAPSFFQLTHPTCPLCNKDCGGLPALRVHLQSVHVASKPFTCEFCDSKFSRASHLARPRRTHTGEKPFECAKCGKSFSRQDKLKTHMDRHIVRETPPGMVPNLSVVKRKKASPAKKSPTSLEDMGMLRPHPEVTQPEAVSVEQQQQPATAALWNNSAFPGFNPYVAGTAAAGPTIFPGQIMASLMKMGEVHQSVPK